MTGDGGQHLPIRAHRAHPQGFGGLCRPEKVGVKPASSKPLWGWRGWWQWMSALGGSQHPSCCGLWGWVPAVREGRVFCMVGLVGGWGSGFSEHQESCWTVSLLSGLGLGQPAIGAQNQLLGPEGSPRSGPALSAGTLVLPGWVSRVGGHPNSQGGSSRGIDSPQVRARSEGLAPCVTTVSCQV